MNLCPNPQTTSSSSSSSSSGSPCSSNNQIQHGTYSNHLRTPHVPTSSSSSRPDTHHCRHRQTKPVSDDSRWIPIPNTRPPRSAIVSQDKIGLTNLLSPRPSLDSRGSHSDPSSREGKKGIGDRNSSIRIGDKKGSKIWSKAKEITRKASFRRGPFASTKKQTLGHDGANDRDRRGGEGMISENEEGWEIITPPLNSDEFIAHSITTQSPPTLTDGNTEEEEEEMMVGARGTGTITRVSIRAQQGSTSDLGMFDLGTISMGVSEISRSVSMNRVYNSNSTSGGYTASGSGSGSGSGERSLEAYLENNQFPIPPSNTLNTLDDHGDTSTRTSPGSILTSNSISSSGQRQILEQRSRQRPNIPHKRSWLYGGPLTLPEDLEEVERKLPDDHPFNTSSSPSQPSHKTSDGGHQDKHYAKFQIPSYCPPSPGGNHQDFIDDDNVNERHFHSNDLLFSLNMLREILYKHNSDSMKLVYSSEDILPPSIISNIEGRLDRYWIKWSKILNSAGERVSRTLNSLEVPYGEKRPFRTDLQNDSHSRIQQQKQYLTSIIPPPVTNDELEKLIWSLEEKGRVASGTYRRMFGGPYLSTGGSPNDGRIEIRKMTELEENQADQWGLRDWMIGEEERLERFSWRDRKK